MFHFHLPFIGRRTPAPPPHAEVRYVAATKAESSEAKLRRDMIANDLRCAIDDLGASERKRLRDLAATIPLTDKQRGRGA